MSFRSFGLTAFAAAAVLLSGCAQPAAALSGVRAVPPSPGAKREARPQVLVKFKPGLRAADLTAFRSEFGTRNVGRIAALDVYIEELVSGASLEDVLAAMNADPLVEYAELNGTVGTQG